MFFTSDTHFGQQRTLELSRRPFVDINEMDFTLISNWNKNVTMNDIVVHAGDFIDPSKISSQLKSFLSILNFKELHWVLGNYDRAHIEDIKNVVSVINRPIYMHLDNFKFIDESTSYVVVHEPNDFEIDATNDDIILFGHTHLAITEYENTRYFVNPGSLSHGALGFRSYGVIDILENDYFVGDLANKDTLELFAQKVIAATSTKWEDAVEI